MLLWLGVIGIGLMIISCPLDQSGSFVSGGADEPSETNSGLYPPHSRRPPMDTLAASGPCAAADHLVSSLSGGDAQPSEDRQRV
jgi:hypothetical protein